MTFRQTKVIFSLWSKKEGPKRRQPASQTTVLVSLFPGYQAQQKDVSVPAPGCGLGCARLCVLPTCSSLLPQLGTAPAALASAALLPTHRGAQQQVAGEKGGWEGALGRWAGPRESTGREQDVRYGVAWLFPDSPAPPASSYQPCPAPPPNCIKGAGQVFSVSNVFHYKHFTIR